MIAARAAAVAALIVAAGCDSGAPVANVQHIKVENPLHDGLLRLTSLNQRIALMRAIRDNGHRCRRVDGGRYQEDYRGMVMWVALCAAEGKHWAIFIAPNGDTQVRACADMHRLSLPQCRPVQAAPESENDVNQL
jgi:hypothetical protein